MAAPAPPEAAGMEIGAPTPMLPEPLPETPPVGAETEIAGSEMPPGIPLGAAIAGAPIPMTAAITAVSDAIATEFCAVTAVFRSVAIFIRVLLLTPEDPSENSRDPSLAIGPVDQRVDRLGDQSAEPFRDRFQHRFFHRATELLAEILWLREQRVEQARSFVLDLVHLAPLKLQQFHDAILVCVVDLPPQLVLGLQALDLEPIDLRLALALLLGVNMAAIAVSFRESPGGPPLAAKTGEGQPSFPVDPARLAWRDPEGDIHASYSGDTIGSAGRSGRHSSSTAGCGCA